MAIEDLKLAEQNRIIYGLSTDIKPTDSTVLPGTKFIETDTNDWYQFSGISWYKVKENGKEIIVDSGVPHKAIISRHLSDDGTTSGGKNAIGNYASPTRFYIQPAAGEVFIIRRIIVEIEDGPTMRAERYGGLPAALPNGVIAQKATNGVQTLDLTDGIPVKTNAGWGRLCYDVDIKTWGAGDELLLVRWTFGASGTDIELIGDNNDSLDIVLNDDFTGIIKQNFLVQGYID